MLALLAGVTGAATGFFSPASTGLLPEVVLAEQLQPANALRSSAAATGEILGPAVGGALVAAAGAGWAMGVDAATFAVSGALLRRLGRTWACGRRTRFRRRGRVGRHILAAMGVGSLVGSLLAVQARPRRPLLLAAAADGLFALPLACLAAAPPAVLVACGALLAGAGMALAISVWETTLQRHIPAESLSRVSSYDWFGSLAFAPLGLAVWGSIATAIGISISLWLAFGLVVVLTAALIGVPEIRRLPASPQAAAPAADPAP